MLSPRVTKISLERKEFYEEKVIMKRKRLKSAGNRIKYLFLQGKP